MTAAAIAALRALMAVRPSNWDDGDDPEQQLAWSNAEAALAALPEGEADYQTYCARRDADPEMRPEGTIEALATCAAMLEKFGPDFYPADNSGRIQFVRCMLDCTAAEIRAFLDSQSQSGRA